MFTDHFIVLIMSAISFLPIYSRQSARFFTVASCGANSYHLFMVASALSGRFEQTWSICSNTKSGTPNLIPSRSHFFPTMFTTTCRRGRLINFESAVKVMILISRHLDELFTIRQLIMVANIPVSMISFTIW